MAVLAHALWVGTGVMHARRRRAISPEAAATIFTLAMAPEVAPEIAHLLPVVAWSAFGSGCVTAVRGYAIASPG